MSVFYLCCPHCIVDDEGNCADGADAHRLPCPEDCLIGQEEATDDPQT